MDPSCAQNFAIRQLSSPPSLLPSFSIALDLIFCPSEMSTLQQLQLQLHFHNNDKKKKKKRRRTLGGAEWDGGKCITLRRISDSDRVVSSSFLSFPFLLDLGYSSVSFRPPTSRKDEPPTRYPSHLTYAEAKGRRPSLRREEREPEFRLHRRKLCV